MENPLDQAKKDLISGYLTTRASILAAAEALPEEACRMAFVGEWTVRELLAHLSGWDYTFLEAFQQILEGRLPDFFSQYDHNWQRFNYRTVRRYRRNSLEETIQGVRESQAKLAAFLERLPSQKFYEDCGICTDNGYHVTISGLMESLVHEEQEHLEQILDFKRSLADLLGEEEAG